MAISPVRLKVDRLVISLRKLPVAERLDKFMEEMDKFPPNKERDLIMSLVPAFVALLEGGTDAPGNLSTVHHHNYVPGSTPVFMEEKTANQQNISGGTFNAPVGINQTFANCFNAAAAMDKPDVQEALKTLITEVERIHPQLGEGDRTKAERKLKTLTEEVAQKDPDKEQIALSGKGLIEAAKTCALMAPPVIIAVKAIAGLFGVPLP